MDSSSQNPEKTEIELKPGGRRVWLDDERQMPPGYTHRAFTADEAIGLLLQGGVEHISLDHDLAHEHYGARPEAGYGEIPRYDPDRYRGEKTGYHVALWMCENGVFPASIHVHTMNPVGGSAMMMLLNRHRPEGTTVERRVASFSTTWQPSKR
jgi:Cyclic-phosphate processing Receiver domain